MERKDFGPLVDEINTVIRDAASAVAILDALVAGTIVLTSDTARRIVNYLRGQSSKIEDVIEEVENAPKEGEDGKSAAAKGAHDLYR